MNEQDLNQRKEVNRAWLWRVKPESNRREWKCDEVKTLPMALRTRLGGENSWIWQVAAVQHDGLLIVDARENVGTKTLCWTVLYLDYEYSVDGCKTWSFCGVEESQ